MLDYKLIEALALVVQEGGFDRAAQRLHLTQSAVSQRIKQLEEQTGQIVLARTTPPRATPAGRRMVKHYLQVKRLEDDLFDTFTPTAREAFVVMALGINVDSLATWFLAAVGPFLEKERVLLDLRADDQAQTHRLLKDGEVIGCISDKDQPMQGCRMEYLGQVDYHLLATPDFAARWFPDGVTVGNVRRAPLLMFNRKDEFHNQLFFKQILEEIPAQFPGHYLPSSEKCVDFITAGLAYGLLPHLQADPLVASGELVNLSPAHHFPVKLYWHCWNLRSPLLERFTQNLVSKARRCLKN